MAPLDTVNGILCVFGLNVRDGKAFDAKSFIFLSIIHQSIEKHHRSVEHPDIFITSDGWINSTRVTNATRISKLLPTLSAHTIVFASFTNKIAIGTQSGQLIILHFPERVMIGTIDGIACIPLPRFLVPHDNWWTEGLTSWKGEWPVLGGSSFVDAFTGLLTQAPPMPIIARPFEFE